MPFSSKPSSKAKEDAFSAFRVLATTLAAGACVVIMAFAGFASFFDHSQKKLQLEEIDNHLTTVSGSALWGIQNWLITRETLISELSKEFSQAPADQSVESILYKPIYTHFFKWTYYGQSNRHFRAWPPANLLGPDYDPRIRPWYLAAAERGSVTVVNPYVDAATNLDMITISAPVYRDGELIGVVGADFVAETLINILKEANLTSSSTVFLFTSEGKFSRIRMKA